MPLDESESRTKLALTTGSKICLLIAAVFLVGAAYFLWVPISIGSPNGRFGCQSAFDPPDGQFPANVCGNLNNLYQFRAAAMLACALFTAGLGVAFFGVNRRTETGGNPEQPAENPTPTDDENPTSTDDESPTPTDDENPTSTDDESPTPTDDENPTSTDDESPTSTDDESPTPTDDENPTSTDDESPTSTDDENPTSTDRVH